MGVIQWIILGSLALACGGLVIYLGKLDRITRAAPGLKRLEPTSLPARVSVIIPAYNEAENIRDCITAVLSSVASGDESLEIWVVDDQSNDGTLELAQSLQQTLSDPRVHILCGQPRPSEQIWMGKNWACVQGADQASGEFLLFLDADVRLKPGAIASALDLMQRESSDLLTLCPEIICGCLGEWLIQPLIMAMLTTGFDFAEVNNPDSETAFAVGQFMLFRRTAYDKLGGHRAVAGEVVEDVEIARRIKQNGLRLAYQLGSDVASVRMYRSFIAVWEGWTKNWYLGSRRNLSLTLYSAIIVLLVCTLPWLGAIALLFKGLFIGLNWVDLVALVLALITILLQYRLRRQIEQTTAIPPRYWWLTGIGGLLVAAIAITSIIKTETGWGWTWRGRPLKLSNET